MACLVECVKQFLKAGQTYWIALSGGMDSTVLLSLCAKVREERPITLHAVYIHHGLNPKADDWAAECADRCAAFNIPFTIKKVNATSLPGQSPEDVARKARYEALAELLPKNAYLLTAHHVEDQAETVLLQLLRGAGSKGLSAMHRIKPLGRGFHARPLLQVERSRLKKYAELEQLTWIEDESNHNLQFTRNFLRHTILPLVKDRLPTVMTTLARVADHCADVEEAIETMIAPHLQSIQGSSQETISIKKLLSYSDTMQRHLLRAWCAQLQFPFPSAKIMHQIQTYFLPAALDKSPYIAWQRVELRRFRDDLYLSLASPVTKRRDKVEWDLQSPLPLPSGKKLWATLSVGQGLLSTIEKVRIQFRQGGERCFLNQCHRTLKNCWQEWGVPPWCRDHIPLIYVQNELVAVVGYFIHEKWLANSKEAGYVLTVEN